MASPSKDGQDVDTPRTASAPKQKELSLLQRKLSKPVRYTGHADTREAYALMQREMGKRPLLAELKDSVGRFEHLHVKQKLQRIRENVLEAIEVMEREVRSNP